MTDTLTFLAQASASLAQLVDGVTQREREARGYGHTLQEIGRQPQTWRATAAALALLEPADVRSGSSIILTGSGSSYYIGAALAPALEAGLERVTRAVPAGELLLSPESFLQRSGPAMVVSFARSGDSPESVAVVDLIRERYPTCQQILVSCNPNGRLATGYPGAARIRTVILGRAVDDESLVMTSSFTNLWLAGRWLGSPDAASVERLASALADLGRRLLERHSEPLAEVARRRFQQALFLGSGARHGAAREAELKMLEMCAGQLATRTETYMGLRHGPMAGLDAETLVVGFMSSDRRRRAYELDLLADLRRKQLGSAFVLCGTGLPAGAAASGDLLVDYGDGRDLDDGDLVPLDVVVGQVLAFFRCLHVGLRPDAPSAGEVITRVVRPFTIHQS